MQPKSNGEEKGKKKTKKDKKKELDDLKQELEMDEHKVSFDVLVARLETNLETVSTIHYYTYICY